MGKPQDGSRQRPTTPQGVIELLKGSDEGITGDIKEKLLDVISTFILIEMNSNIKSNNNSKRTKVDLQISNGEWRSTGSIGGQFTQQDFQTISSLTKEGRGLQGETTWGEMNADRNDKISFDEFLFYMIEKTDMFADSGEGLSIKQLFESYSPKEKLEFLARILGISFQAQYTGSDKFQFSVVEKTTHQSGYITNDDILEKLTPFVQQYFNIQLSDKDVNVSDTGLTYRFKHTKMKEGTQTQELSRNNFKAALMDSIADRVLKTMTDYDVNYLWQAEQGQGGGGRGGAFNIFEPKSEATYEEGLPKLGEPHKTEMELIISLRTFTGISSNINSDYKIGGSSNPTTVERQYLFGSKEAMVDVPKHNVNDNDWKEFRFPPHRDAKGRFFYGYANKGGVMTKIKYLVFAPLMPVVFGLGITLKISYNLLFRNIDRFISNLPTGTNNWWGEIKDKIMKNPKTVFAVGTPLAAFFLLAVPGAPAFFAAVGGLGGAAGIGIGVWFLTVGLCFGGNPMGSSGNKYQRLGGDEAELRLLDKCEGSLLTNNPEFVLDRYRGRESDIAQQEIRRLESVYIKFIIGAVNNNTSNQILEPPHKIKFNEFLKNFPRFITDKKTNVEKYNNYEDYGAKSNADIQDALKTKWAEHSNIQPNRKLNDAGQLFDKRWKYICSMEEEIDLKNDVLPHGGEGPHVIVIEFKGYGREVKDTQGADLEMSLYSKPLKQIFEELDDLEKECSVGERMSYKRDHKSEKAKQKKKTYFEKVENSVNTIHEFFKTMSGGDNFATLFKKENFYTPSRCIISFDYQRENIHKCSKLWKLIEEINSESKEGDSRTKQNAPADITKDIEDLHNGLKTDIENIKNGHFLFLNYIDHLKMNTSHSAGLQRQFTEKNEEKRKKSTQDDSEQIEKNKVIGMSGVAKVGPRGKVLGIKEAVGSTSGGTKPGPTWWTTIELNPEWSNYSKDSDTIALSALGMNFTGAVEALLYFKNKYPALLIPGRMYGYYKSKLPSTIAMSLITLGLEMSETRNIPKSTEKINKDYTMDSDVEADKAELLAEYKKTEYKQQIDDLDNRLGDAPSLQSIKNAPTALAKGVKNRAKKIGTVVSNKKTAAVAVVGAAGVGTAIAYQGAVIGETLAITGTAALATGTGLLPIAGGIVVGVGILWGVTKVTIIGIKNWESIKQNDWFWMGSTIRSSAMIMSAAANSAYFAGANAAIAAGDMKRAVRVAGRATVLGSGGFLKYMGQSRRWRDREEENLNQKAIDVLWKKSVKEEFLPISDEPPLDDDDDSTGLLDEEMMVFSPALPTDKIYRGFGDYPPGIRLIRPSIEIKDLEALNGKSIPVEWVKNKLINKKQIMKGLRSGLKEFIIEIKNDEMKKYDLVLMFVTDKTKSKNPKSTGEAGSEDPPSKKMYNKITEAIQEKTNSIETLIAEGAQESEIDTLKKILKDWENQKEEIHDLHKLADEKNVIKDVQPGIFECVHEEKDSKQFAEKFGYDAEGAEEISKLDYLLPKLKTHFKTEQKKEIEILRKINILLRRMNMAYPMFTNKPMTVFKQKRLTDNIYSVWCYYDFFDLYDDLYKDDGNSRKNRTVCNFVKKNNCLISRLLSFKFTVNKSNILDQDTEYNAFRVKFLKQINTFMIGKIYRQPTAIEYRIIRGKDSYIFDNKNVLIRKFRDGIISNFTNEITNKLNDRGLYDMYYNKYKKHKDNSFKAYKLLADEDYIKSTQIYNLILRITCGLMFTMLHASNFTDYDLLTISQYNHVMEKLFNIPEFKIDNDDKRKPVNLIELLNIEENYWKQMCIEEAESINRARIAFFYDQIEKERRYNLYRTKSDKPHVQAGGEEKPQPGQVILSREEVEGMFSGLDRNPSMLSLANNKLAEIYRGPSQRINYCAQKDEKYDFSKHKLTGVGDAIDDEYIHKYDDYYVPHIALPRTWKEIEDGGFRVQSIGGGMNAQNEPQSPVRFVLHQDFMNYTKYYVNTQLIPSYEYFDSFYDCFCKLAKSLVVTEGQEKGVPIINWLGMILLLEPYNFQKLEKQPDADEDSSDSEDGWDSDQGEESESSDEDDDEDTDKIKTPEDKMRQETDEIKKKDLLKKGKMV